jgi:hypothetical protein
MRLFWGFKSVEELYPSPPLEVDSADTSQLPKEKNLHGKFLYFQITQPGISTVTPLYQFRRLLYKQRRLLRDFSQNKIQSIDNIRSVLPLSKVFCGIGVCSKLKRSKQPPLVLLHGTKLPTFNNSVW